MQSCKDVNVEPTGTFRDFFVKYKTALKEHVPYKYRDIWKILDKKAAQKPYQGNIFTNTDEIKVITILGFYKWKNHGLVLFCNFVQWLCSKLHLVIKRRRCDILILTLSIDFFFIVCTKVCHDARNNVLCLFAHFGCKSVHFSFDPGFFRNLVPMTIFFLNYITLFTLKCWC